MKNIVEYMLFEVISENTLYEKQIADKVQNLWSKRVIVAAIETTHAFLLVFSEFIVVSVFTKLSLCALFEFLFFFANSIVSKTINNISQLF